MESEFLCKNKTILSMISKQNQELSESLYSLESSLLEKFITGSFSENSSFNISNFEQDSIVINSVYQDYKGILEVFSESPCKKDENDRVSIALTTAKGSLVEECKKNSEKHQEICPINAFTVPGKFFCKRCMKETISIIKYQPLTLGFWNSLFKLFHSNKCCSEKITYPDIIHECPLCRSMLARISSI